MSLEIPQQIFRFAPTPNGALHIGHAYSALLNFDMANKTQGKLLLRFEDIDTQRCSREYETAILKDLEWLRIEWSGDIRRQSDHFKEYESYLQKLENMDLLYPSFLSRSQIKDFVATAPASWPSDPDGVPHYPGEEKQWSEPQRKEAMASHENYAIRLDIQKAIDIVGEKLFWREQGSKTEGDASCWGDVLLGRESCPASYHLCVVIDDALAGVNHIVRGQDLFHATSLHCLLQKLLGFPQPHYHHHRLICDDNGRKLSKSQGDITLAQWRRKGMNVQDIREHLGLIK